MHRASQRVCLKCLQIFRTSWWVRFYEENQLLFVWMGLAYNKIEQKIKFSHDNEISKLFQFKHINSFSFARLQVLCLLYGVFINLPPALTLQCYACLEYPGSQDSCASASVVQCPSFFDSCMTMVASAEYYGMQYTTTTKNCSSSIYGCDESVMCGYVQTSVSGSGGSLKSCSLSCCSGVLCNG